MCTPAAPFILAGAQTGIGIMGEAQKEKYGKQVYDQARTAANDNALRQYQALQDRQLQENAAAAQAIEKNRRAAETATGSAITTAAESGVAGASVAALLQDFQRTSLEYEHSVTRNQAFLRDQFQREALGIRANQEAEINRAIPEPPNYLGVLIQGATSALSIYGKQTAQSPNSGSAGAYQYPDYD